ncbi:glutaredoxin family protein [Streptomyces sp. NPDC056529]|uniref:glutaredoxin family protein n=1 Tax=Streptomyces sp. NPDC056529 TaxID=3345855 RepID=UPI0036C8A6D4
MGGMETIKEQVAGTTVLLYMKGSLSDPQGSDSAQAAQAVMACGEKFVHVDLLKNPEIRAALPEYSKLTAIPQLWVAGKLVGGIDVLREMFENGELEVLIKQAVAEAKTAGA